jgi:hypothetical protein
MATYDTHRDTPDPKEERLAAVADALSRQGYVISERAPGRVRMDFEGSMFGGSLARNSHRLVVTLDRKAIRFAFRADLVLTLADDDAAALESRVESAWAETAPADREGEAHARGEGRTIEREVLVTRCKFCQAVTPVDLAACKSCGAAKYF